MRLRRTQENTTPFPPGKDGTFAPRKRPRSNIARAGYIRQLPARKCPSGEMADARDLKSLDGDILRVRVPPRAPDTTTTKKSAGRTIPMRRRNATPKYSGKRRSTTRQWRLPPHEHIAKARASDARSETPPELRHPNPEKTHAMAKIFCKHCGQSFPSISCLTASKCPRHPDGTLAGRPSPAL